MCCEESKKDKSCALFSATFFITLQSLKFGVSSLDWTGLGFGKCCKNAVKGAKDKLRLGSMYNV